MFIWNIPQTEKFDTMKNLTGAFTIISIFLAATFCENAWAGKYKIQVSASQSDAKIYVDGRHVGNGQADVLVLKNSCVTVSISKTGYLGQQVTYCNKKNYSKPPKTDFFQLKPDDAFIASLQTDIANVDISVKTNQEEISAWRLLSQIITSYFDVIEVTDRETGYLRTSWVVQSFTQNTIRTRVIIKLGSSEPLTYKVKIISEQSGIPNTSVKRDERFREWDRILRKYGTLINEIQSRLAS